MKMTPRIRALDKIYKRRDRYEIPEWQRDAVWNQPKKQKLIDSILRGWKLPKFYFVKVEDDEYEVVDGQQMTYLMKDDTRVVQLGGYTYTEGLLEGEIQGRQRGSPSARSPIN